MIAIKIATVIRPINRFFSSTEIHMFAYDFGVSPILDLSFQYGPQEDLEDRDSRATREWV